MTASSNPPPDPPGLIGLLYRMGRSWTVWFLLALFAVTETLAQGILPAMLKTIEANIATAQATTEDAKANVAKIREQGIADLVAEDARIKSGQALQADRYRKAEARLAANMAKILHEKAINSPQLKQAETEINRQKAIIDEEKARHEERRARAEVNTTVARKEIADQEEKLRSATVRTEVIERRFVQFQQCVQGLMQSDPDAIIASGSCSFGACNSNASQRLFRSRCLPQIR
jgi:hypothetical protein